MRRERGTVEETAEEVVVMIERENKHRPMSLQLPRPTRRLIERLINLIPAFDRDAARYGRIAANRKYRSKLKHLVRPLQNHPN